MYKFKGRLTLSIAMYVLFFVIIGVTLPVINPTNFGQLVVRVITKLILTNGVFIVIHEYYGRYKKLFTSVLLITISSIIFPIVLYLTLMDLGINPRFLLGLIIVSGLFPLFNLLLIIKYKITNVLESELAKPLIYLAVASLLTDSTFLFVFLSPVINVFMNSFGIMFIVGPLPIMIIKIYFLISFNNLQTKPKRATINYGN
jgi:hypothetical protein